MKLVPDSVVNAAKKIKYLFLDVDGVLTDGKLYFSDRGEELKAFNIKDGLGIKLLKMNNIGAGIILRDKQNLLIIEQESLNWTLCFKAQGIKQKH